MAAGLARLALGLALLACATTAALAASAGAPLEASVTNGFTSGGLLMILWRLHALEARMVALEARKGK